jgi:hypothetical protein
MRLVQTLSWFKESKAKQSEAENDRADYYAIPINWQRSLVFLYFYYVCYVCYENVHFHVFF